MDWKEHLLAWALAVDPRLKVFGAVAAALIAVELASAALR